MLVSILPTNTQILKTQSFVLGLRAKPVVDDLLSLQSLILFKLLHMFYSFWTNYYYYFNYG